MENLPHSHKISIVIVTCDSMPALDNSLKRLAIVTGRTDFELLVVDNNSTDDSVSHVRKHFPSASIIELKDNIGFAAACNKAARIAGGEYLLFHNPDLELDEGAIERLTAACESREKFGAGGGRLRFPDGTFQATCRQFPNMTNIIFSRGSAFSRFLNPRGKYTLGDFREITEVPAVAGTLMIISRKLFEAMGGFDERFFMYMEDTDLCLRLNRAGYRNYFVPDAGGVHLWGKGSRGGRLRRNWYHHMSLWKHFLKHFPNPITFIIIPLVLAVHLVLVSVLGKPSRG